ncbi:MAG: hypothetical protein P4L93_06005, partial [Coriobacteriia bacterium]|nr:hypothetical protein [Coriobacteriia bacterium]
MSKRTFEAILAFAIAADGTSGHATATTPSTSENRRFFVEPPQWDTDRLSYAQHLTPGRQAGRIVRRRNRLAGGGLA